jgi:hypothetical protein
VADLKLAPGEDICDYCDEAMTMEENGEDPLDTPGYCICYTSDMDYEDWVMGEEMRMDYTKTLEDLLHNKNEKWLADLLAGEMTVKCTYDRNTDLPTFKILRKTPIGKWGADCRGAYNLLKEWGIFELSCKSSMEFVIVFGQKGKAKIGDYNITKTLLREVRVPRPSI